MRKLVTCTIGAALLLGAAVASAQTAGPTEAAGEVDEGRPTAVVVLVGASSADITAEALSQARMAVLGVMNAQSGRTRREARLELDPGLAERASTCTDDACLTGVGYDAQAAYLLVGNMERAGAGYRMTAILVDVLNGATIASAAFDLPPDPAGFAAAAASPLEPLANAVPTEGPTSGGLAVTVDQVGAAIFVDGQRVGTSPLAPVRDVAPGPHTVRVQLGGFITVEQTVEVTPGAQAAVQATMVPLPPPPEPVPVAPTPLYRRWWLWTAVGAAAVAIGLGVGLGVGLSNDDPTGPGQEWGVPFPDYEPR